MLYLPVTETVRYHYDFNLIHRELADGEVQNYFYDLHDQLVKAEIFKKDGTKETWAYTYDALGRRIGKGRLKDGEVSGSLEEETRFVWDGSHLLQEVHSDGWYTYIYTYPDSYEPLAQVHNRTNEDGERKPTRNKLLPLRPNRHPKRDDRWRRQPALVRGVLRLGQTKE